MIEVQRRRRGSPGTMQKRMDCNDFHLKLNEFRCNGKYCDVIVRAKGKNFLCHRVVLAAVSEYFKQNELGGFLEERNAHLNVLHDIDVETFEKVMQAMYSGQMCRKSPWSTETSDIQYFDFHATLNRYRRQDSKYCDVTIHRRQDSKYCDVTIQVQGRNFLCHRVVLAAASKYFDVLFGSYFKEKTVQETVVQDIDVDTFTEVMKLMYTYREQMSGIKEHNFLNLLRASSILLIDSIQEGCVEFIMKNIEHIPDHIDKLILVHPFNVPILTSALCRYIFYSFNQFHNNERFMTIEFADLKWILNEWIHHMRDKLSFKSENLLLDLLIRWVHYNPEERKQYLRELLEKVDFERISSDYIRFMLKYFERLVEVSDVEMISAENVASLMRESELNSNSSVQYELSHIEDSKNRLLLKKTIAKYFMVDRQLSGCSEHMITVSSQDEPNFCKSELGLHIFVELARTSINDDGSFSGERFENGQVYIVNKYKDDWSLSCEKTVWHNNRSERYTVSYEPYDSLYSLEVFQDGSFWRCCRQSFCTYASVDTSLASSVLTPPPINLNACVNSYNFCASPLGIFLYASKYKYVCKTLRFWDLFRYDCENDEWSPVCELPFKKYQSCRLAVDNNSIYLIGFPDVYALDYRTPNWMKLQNSFHTHNFHSKYCILNGNIYLYSEEGLETFDPKAGKWEQLRGPESSLKFFLSYENRLWGIRDDPFNITSYDPVSNEWYAHELLNQTISNDCKFQSRKARKKYDESSTFHTTIKDAVIFKRY